MVAEGDDDRVLGRRGLELEVELHAEALAQREAEGPVDAASIGRVRDELHAAALVEEALEHERLPARHDPERRVRGGEVLRDLDRRLGCDPDLVRQPRDDRIRAGSRGLLPAVTGGVGRTARRSRTVRLRRLFRGFRRLEALLDLGAQARNRLRELARTRGGLADPERDRRRLPLRVRDTHLSFSDTQDLPRRIAELEDVAGDALDGEVLVDRPDHSSRGLEYDGVVRVLGDGSARGDRHETRAAPTAQASVHGVAMEVGAAAAALR